MLYIQWDKCCIYLGYSSNTLELGASPCDDPTTGSRRNNELPLPIRAGNTITLYVRRHKGFSPCNGHSRVSTNSSSPLSNSAGPLSFPTLDSIVMLNFPLSVGNSSSSRQYRSTTFEFHSDRASVVRLRFCTWPGTHALPSPFK